MKRNVTRGFFLEVREAELHVTRYSRTWRIAVEVTGVKKSLGKELSDSREYVIARESILHMN